jgi:general secretion pathway protein D
MGALITALDKNNDIHILQKPNLTATDNEEASIEVGKKVPYQTRTSTTDNETYNSYDYQSVGLTLKITPHIGEGRNVRLDIYTELSALTTDAVTTTPTTRNRIVDTTVIVQDQNMLVIGGLIDDNTDKSVSKVPLLGSIPILGRLFQYEKHQSTKTNLYIFITPRVVKNDSEANRLTREIQDNMTPEETEIIELYGPLEGRESITLPHTTEPSE